jgi:GTPase involved in cell partitioning and DNA repair
MAQRQGGGGSGGGGGGGGNNILVVPQAAQALNQLKYEVALELGIQIPQDGYYGYMATRDTGAIGGHMVRRMVQIAEQQLAGTMLR